MRRVVAMGVAATTALVLFGAHGASAATPGAGDPTLAITGVSSANAIAYGPGSGTIYVADKAGIERADLGAQTVGDPVTSTLGYNGLAVSPDGSLLYAAQAGLSRVIVVDTATNRWVREVAVPGIQPDGVAVSPDGSTLYVIGTQDGSVSVVDAVSGQVEATIPAPAGLTRASQIALSDDGRTIFVAADKDGVVWSADATTQATNVTITGLTGLTSLAVADDLTAYAGIGGSAPAIATIDVARGTVVRRAPVAATPVALTIDGPQVFAAEPSLEQMEVLSLPIAPYPVFVDSIAHDTVGMTDAVIWEPTPSGIDVTYQWYADGEPIPGATGRVVPLTSAQLGAKMSVIATAHGVGLATDFSKWSDGGGVLAPMRPSTPMVSGQALVGRTVAARVRSWGPHTRVHFKYQWFAGSRPIKGATQAKLRVHGAQQGQPLRVRVTGTQYLTHRAARSRPTRKVR